jgi:hypothetical protein
MQPEFNELLAGTTPEGIENLFGGRPLGNVPDRFSAELLNRLCHRDGMGLRLKPLRTGQADYFQAQGRVFLNNFRKRRDIIPVFFAGLHQLYEDAWKGRKVFVSGYLQKCRRLHRIAVKICQRDGFVNRIG